MSCDLDSCLDGLDRTFLNLSSMMAEPLCAAWHQLRFRMVAPLDPDKFENCASRIKEVATRVLIGLVAVFAIFVAPIPIFLAALVLGVGSKGLRAIGFALQRQGVTHVRGNLPEKTLDPQNPELKTMSWNICGVGGGMSLDHGGVIDWRSRLPEIVKKIRDEDPDVLVLQEVYDTALAERLIGELKEHYAHFYIHLGANVMGSVGGCMVLSKCAVHKFSNTPFSTNNWMLNRGFATLEIKASPQDSVPCARVIGTHFIHGDTQEDKEHRKTQLSEVLGSVKDAFPTILAGDLNMERDGAEGVQLSHYLDHGYTAAEPTCTNELVAQWAQGFKSVPGETIDYVSLFKSKVNKSFLKECHLVRAYDASYNTKTALSDHSGVVAKLVLVRA